MSDGLDREPARILDSVRAGNMTTAQAEIWAKANGRKPTGESRLRSDPTCRLLIR